MPLWPPTAVVPSPHEPPPPPDFHPPLRPSFGRIGRPILLRANHFQVKIPNCVLYHYDISIVPDKCPRRVNREIVEALVMSQAQYFAHQKLVFDGRKNLYSRRPLPIGRDRVSHVLYMYSCVHVQGFNYPEGAKVVSKSLGRHHRLIRTPRTACAVTFCTVRADGTALRDLGANHTGGLRACP